MISFNLLMLILLLSINDYFFSKDFRFRMIKILYLSIFLSFFQRKKAEI